ncbi:MAG: hypothetical protein KC940_04925, partial [Candidatus Omnitrophica bacterium]|nr:hypothetical protein [Candidatus Omnitrophota bacterium]
MSLQTILVLLLVGLAATPVLASEKQLTSSPKNHDLDNTHNFSGDDRFLCYDTRGLIGPGIENCQSIEKVEVANGQETIIYQPKESIIGDQAAPGIGAPYFCPTENKVAFIHGPLVEEVESRGYYAKSNR